MREASAFAPGHLTGFFEICDEPEEPLRKGSRGAGVSITLGTKTRAKVEMGGGTSARVIINGRASPGAVVSRAVISKMVAALGKPCRVVAEQEVAVPIGSGFGASGGGALSLALALNEALGLGLARTEAATFAHLAEIECGTGLGTVLAALTGGFGLTARAGGPGVGERLRLGHDADLRAVCLHFGPISTREALSDPGLRLRINERGGRFVDELQREPSVSLFMALSRRFAEHVGLITPRMRRALEETDRADIPCSMAMLGETLFTLTDPQTAEGLAALLRAAAPGHEVLVAGIDDQGARPL